MDNPALTAALQEGSGVVPVFVLDEKLLAAPAEKRKAFLVAGLRALEQDLRRCNSGLIIRRGDPVAEIPRLAGEIGARAVYAEADVTPYSNTRDERIGETVDLRLVHGLGVHPAGAVTKADGSPYTVFTPYSKAWRSLPFSGRLEAAPVQMPAIPVLPSEALPDISTPPGFVAGEYEAQQRLERFLAEGIHTYTDDRNMMSQEGTSGLSAYLRFGMISPRHAVVSAMRAAEEAKDLKARKGCETWINELIWREFYQSILYHFPYVQKESFNVRFKGMTWRDAPEDLCAWQEGRTGYPVVDAAMRQLTSTGWMHNRARMIAASFLVKHLLINWQEGERWFMRMLIDGDPAANNGGWQWVAGTGTDAAPYFRVFNPVLQGKKFDPKGDYVRRWVPELAHVSEAFIHEPWLLPENERPTSYPEPLVEHSFARQRALDWYSKATQK